MLTFFMNMRQSRNYRQRRSFSLINHGLYNYLRHLMRFRDASFIKYFRAKKATEKLKIHGEYKVLRNEVKMKTKQAKKILPKFI